MHRERFRRIAGYALSRREAYLIVGLVFAAVVVTIVGGWPAWVIGVSVLAGVLLLLLLIMDSLFDPNVERDAAVADVDLGRLRDRDLQAKVRRALEYVRAAQRLARQDRGTTLDAADDELPELEQAARSIYQMCLRLQEFRSDALIQRDLGEIRQQRARRAELSDDQREQLTTLERLSELVASAQREIDAALAHLGRAYAEMQVIKVTPELRGREADALEQLGASTRRLSDLAAGYDEAFGGQLPPGAPARG